MTREQRYGRVLLLVLLGSLLLRLAIIFTVGDIELHGDEISYDSLARKVLAGEGFAGNDQGSLRPTSYRAPLHPATLAVVYAVTGGNVTAARIWQSLVLVAAAGVVYLIGKRIWDEKVGLTAAILTAFHPLLIAFGTWLWAEPLYILLALIALWLLIRFAQEGGGWQLVVAGVLWGLATLTREAGLALAPLLALWLVWWVWRQPRPELKSKWRILIPAGVFMLGFVLVVAPWTIRNYLVHQAFIPVTSVTGLALWLGNNPWQEWGPVYERYFLPDTEVAREQEAMRQAIAYIMDSQPLWLPRKVLLNWPGLLGPENFLLRHLRLGLYGNLSDGAYNVAYWFLALFHMIFGAAGIVGMWLANGKNRPGRYLLLLPVITLLIADTVLHTNSRHRVAVWPIVALFAGWAWVHRREAWRRMRRGWPAVGMWISLLIFLFFAFPNKRVIFDWLRGVFGL